MQTSHPSQFIHSFSLFPSSVFSRSCFGKRIAGSGRRLNECLILEASELLVIDYPDSASHHHHHPASTEVTTAFPASSYHSSTPASSAQTVVTASLTGQQTAAPRYLSDDHHHLDAAIDARRTPKTEGVHFADLPPSAAAPVASESAFGMQTDRSSRVSCWFCFWWWWRCC